MTKLQQILRDSHERQVKELILKIGNRLTRDEIELLLNWLGEDEYNLNTFAQTLDLCPMTIL